MFNRGLTKIIIFSIFCFLGINQCRAQSIDTIEPSIKILNLSDNKTIDDKTNIDLNNNVNNSIKEVKLIKHDDFSSSVNATDKFVQCNIRSSWENFKTIIDEISDNDFLYINLANKMAELGFFDLSEIAVSKMKDKDITSISTNAMEKFYYPNKKLKLDDELFLAEIYSNISFNNQASEATNELIKKDSLLSDYDYANYIAALGFYKSDSPQKAYKYINKAIAKNPKNLNYYKLKAEILADENKSDKAIKIVRFLKKQNLDSFEYERKINSLEQFILYKTKKAKWEKNYYLGYYYYIENDRSKAIKTLQSALSERKKSNKNMIYGLMSEIYFDMKDFEKASDTAQKAYKINSSNPRALLTLGNLSYENKNYNQALHYYKKASSKDKKSYTPLIKEAQTYQKISNTKKAKEIYTKIIKNYPDSWEAYYNIALADKNQTEAYLKKSLAINPSFEDGWIELAKTQINQKNYALAKEYLSNVLYIDENNFKYYYYQGLVCKNTGDYNQAKYNFKKCLKLNSKFTEAQTELESIQKDEGNILNQDNI